MNSMDAPIHQPHRYRSGVGDECDYCRQSRWNAVHFNGDASLAKAAHQVYDQERRHLIEWQNSLGPGARVMVRETHPKSNLVGRTGTVAEMTIGGRPDRKVAVVKFTRAPGEHATCTLGIAVHFLEPAPAPAAVPRFTSQEEADEWLEDTAKEMGVSTEREVPFFASQEEADEWLERQAGEPYVPPSWRAVTGEGVRGLKPQWIAYDEVQSSF